MLVKIIILCKIHSTLRMQKKLKRQCPTIHLFKNPTTDHIVAQKVIDACLQGPRWEIESMGAKYQDWLVLVLIC